MKNALSIRVIICAGLILVSCFAFAGELRSPLDTVNSRMEAHNAHDMAKFLETYSEGIQIYGYPNIAFGKPGKQHIRNIFGPLFAEKSVQTEIHHQIQNGNYVINHETVVRRNKTTEYVSIYEVSDGLIVSVRFINDK